MFQWAEEFQKFTEGITTRTVVNELGFLTGYNARLAQYNLFKENVLIVSYAQVLNDYEAIKQAMGENYMVVMDECHKFKGRKTQTHMACQEIASKIGRAHV